ncbi:MAG TPA: TPM domain-containing protein [Steroidobacteraceae bacterium]|nr:TPM domain-containing protein [Steroidobacteraceae bacterium]
MSKRPAVLFTLLLLVAGIGGYHLISRQRDGGQPASVAPARKPPTANRARETHPRIDDAADILGPFVPRLGRMADAFATDLGVDVQVVSSRDGSTPIEIQADQAFGQRGIGREAPTGGLLIILDPKLESARIEVGYALEGVMTDLHMGRLARDQLAPYVAYGAAGMAVMDVLHYLREQALLAAAAGNLEIPDKARELPEYLEYKQYLSGGAGARTALSSLPADADLKKPVPANQRSRYAPADTPEESVAALLRVMADLAGDPTLELYTEGSQLLRTNYPLAPFEELQRLERIERSKPLSYWKHEGYAVASSTKPVRGFVPILLRREGNLWRVDLVETWKNLFFDADGNYFLRNSNTPYAAGLRQFGRGGYYDLAALPLRTSSLDAEISSLEKRQDVLSTLRRGELWLRNAFVFPRAWLAYEEARRKAPNDPLVLETLGSRAQYLGFPELAIPALEKIGTGLELTIAAAYDEMGDPKGAQRWVDRALEENPLDVYALRWREYLAKHHGSAEELLSARRSLEAVTEDAKRAGDPVVLWFHPGAPTYESQSTIVVDGTTVHDHSHFGVTLRNTSGREVEIESVRLTSQGTAGASGLGDVKKNWTFPAGKNRLKAGEAVYFDKQWGFVVDTGHEHVRYIFRLCWHGASDPTPVRQCRTQWIDVLPQ